MAQTNDSVNSAPFAVQTYVVALNYTTSHKSIKPASLAAVHEDCLLLKQKNCAEAEEQEMGIAIK